MKTKIPQEDTHNPSDTGSSQQGKNTDEVLVWKEKYLRALADYQNLLRRTQQEREENERYAAVKTISQLIGVFDVFEKAQIHLSDPGLGLALTQLSTALTTLGVIRIDPVGKPFDPELMECVEAENGAQTVSDTVIPGYMMNGRLIRPAKVRVMAQKTNSSHDQKDHS